jgi:DNA polymerase II small subunit
MDQLKSAIKLLIDAGLIVQPDALESLQQLPNPIEAVKEVLRSNPNLKIVSRDQFNTIDSATRSIDRKKPSPIAMTKRGSSVKGKVPRRKLSEIGTKVHQTPIDTVKVKTSPISIPDNKTIIRTSLDDLVGLTNFESDLQVIKNYEATNTFIGDIDCLTGYFQDRFNRLSSIFRKRVDLSGITKIKDLRRTEGTVSVIGMVTEKKLYHDRSGILTLEDITADRYLRVVIPKSNPILMEEVAQILNDSVICVIGYLRKGTLIANEILLPDIPTITKRNRADIPVHVAFLSDIHVGTKNFLEEPLNKFIKFLNGEYGGRKLRQLSAQTKYVVFGGDSVDGIGIYPNQDKELKIDSIRDQYAAFTGFVEQIPEDVQVVIIPGNHDMVRSAEPQPQIAPTYVPGLASLPNVHLLSNPSQIALHNVNVLLYHCTSLMDVMNNLPGAPIDQPTHLMRHLLRTRHLAPIWGAKTPIATEPQDHLVIDQVPNVFHGGHVHINGEMIYRGVHIVNSGTMQKQTAFQKSLNIIPTPGQVPILNLQTFDWSRINLMKN